MAESTSSCSNGREDHSQGSLPASGNHGGPRFLHGCPIDKFPLLHDACNHPAAGQVLAGFIMGGQYTAPFPGLAQVALELETQLRNTGVFEPPPPSIEQLRKAANKADNGYPQAKRKADDVHKQVEKLKNILEE